MSAGTQKSPTMGTEFSPTLLLLLCHKISSSPFLSAAPETGVSLKEGPAVAAQKGCDGGGHMPLRPHGERPAAGNPRVGEGLGGRTEAQGGKAERARRPGKRRPRCIRCRGDETHASPSPRSDPGRTDPSVRGNRVRCASAASPAARAGVTASREAWWRASTSGGPVHGAAIR